MPGTQLDADRLQHLRAVRGHDELRRNRLSPPDSRWPHNPSVAYEAAHPTQFDHLEGNLTPGVIPRPSTPDSAQPRLHVRNQNLHAHPIATF
jgi:hypothetical protein